MTSHYYSRTGTNSTKVRGVTPVKKHLWSCKSIINATSTSLYSIENKIDFRGSLFLHDLGIHTNLYNANIPQHPHVLLQLS